MNDPSRPSRDCSRLQVTTLKANVPKGRPMEFNLQKVQNELKL